MHQPIKQNQLDELFAERTYLWTVAYPDPGEYCPKLYEAWQLLNLAPQPLRFQDFEEVAESLSAMVGIPPHEDAVEVFVAHRIWIAKCVRADFADTKIGCYISSDKQLKWLHQNRN